MIRIYVTAGTKKDFIYNSKWTPVKSVRHDISEPTPRLGIEPTTDFETVYVGTTHNDFTSIFYGNFWNVV